MQLIENRIADLKSQIPGGGCAKPSFARLLFVGFGRAAVDERRFEALRRIRDPQAICRSPIQVHRARQFYMLPDRLRRCARRIPAMLPADAEIRRKAFDLIDQVPLRARGEYSDEDRARLGRVSQLFWRE